MLSAAFASPATRVPFADPIAQELLGEEPTAPALGVFVRPDQFGFSTSTVGGAAAAGASAGSIIPGVGTTVGAVIGTVVSLAGSLFARGGGQPSDPLEHLTDQIPPEAINAHVGEGGWWYDNTDGHQLSHEEAAQKQHAVGAASINAHVGAGGWWYDNNTGQQLSHADAWSRYQQLVAHGGLYGEPLDMGGGTPPITFTPAPPVNTPPTLQPTSPGSPTIPWFSPAPPPTLTPHPTSPTLATAGFTSPTMLALAAAAVVAVIAMGRKKA